MFLIIGLGNPGKKYEKTRHNAGFQAVDFLAGKQEWLTDKKSNSKIIKERKYILAKPQTYMNESGQAVRALADYYKIKSNQIVIIYDEINLLFGDLRVRNKGSAAGHNGIKSIIQHLNTDGFWRIRIGTKNKLIEKISMEKFVLENFSKTELKELKDKILPILVKKLEEIIK